MLLQTQGIVLRQIRYRERSLIIDLFTEQKGLCSCIINGVRSSHPKFPPALFQIMMPLDVILYYRDTGPVLRIKEVKSTHIYQALPYQPVLSAIGQFMNEVIRHVVHPHIPQEGLFHFYREYLLHLDSSPPDVQSIPIHFLVDCAQRLGIGSDLDIMLQQMALKDHSLKISNIHTDTHTLLNGRDRLEVIRSLLKYFELHISGFRPVQSLDILHTLLHTTA